MTVSLEKVFFAYILKNKNLFQVILPDFFKNPDIKFVYTIIRDYVLENYDVEVPSIKQIAEMVKLKDVDNRISGTILKTLLKKDLSGYDEERFIKPKLRSWILVNRVGKGLNETIDEYRFLENSDDSEEVLERIGKIKTIFEESTSMEFEDDDDLGADFDDPEEHIQDHSQDKVNSGYETINGVLGGGWDRKTLNLIMGPTNSGKSLWLQNFAVKSANAGFNVLYVTLEMSTKKTLKRIGSMRLRIPIDDYDQKSNNKSFMKKKIDNLHKSADISNDLFNNKMGKIMVKFFPAGTATYQNIETSIKKIKEMRGIDIDLVVVDYLTLLVPIKGLNIESNLYQKGKHLAEGLRSIAARYNLPVITAMQVSKDAWNTNDITLENIPESKAIAETADTFFGIIRTEDMKMQNIYRLKLLKQRDGDFSKSQMKFDLNPKYLTIENDIYVDRM